MNDDDYEWVDLGNGRQVFRRKNVTHGPEPINRRIGSGREHVNQALGVPAHQREEFQKHAPPGVHYDQPDKHNFVNPRFTSMGAYYAELKRRKQHDRSGFR